MFKAFEFCLPTNATKVPAGPEWLHEIKQDGFRFRVERDGDRVRLLTRNGHDWSKRYPWIVGSALKNRTRQFVIDGEAVVLGVDGLSDFEYGPMTFACPTQSIVFVCEVCGKRGADVRPDFNSNKKPVGMMGYRNQTGR